MNDEVGSYRWINVAANQISNMSIFQGHHANTRTVTIRNE